MAENGKNLISAHLGKPNQYKTIAECVVITKAVI